jgi:hypothetical protein
MWPILNCYRDTAFWIYKYKTNVNDNNLLFILFSLLFNISMKNLLQFTITDLKSHRQPQCTLQLVCEDRVLSFVIYV